MGRLPNPAANLPERAFYNGSHVMREGQRSIIVGLLMPIGILAEVFLGAPLLFVLVGGVSMLAGTVWLGLAAARLHLTPASASKANS